MNKLGAAERKHLRKHLGDKWNVLVANPLKAAKKKASNKRASG